MTFPATFQPKVGVSERLVAIVDINIPWPDSTRYLFTNLARGLEKEPDISGEHHADTKI